MSLSPRSAVEGLVSFRLSDLPPNVREWGWSEYVAGRVNGSGELSPREIAWSVDVRLAAERPSDRVYWIPAGAYTKLLRKFKLDPEVNGDVRGA